MSKASILSSIVGEVTRKGADLLNSFPLCSMGVAGAMSSTRSIPGPLYNFQEAGAPPGDSYSHPVQALPEIAMTWPCQPASIAGLRWLACH